VRGSLAQKLRGLEAQRLSPRCPERPREGRTDYRGWDRRMDIRYGTGLLWETTSAALPVRLARRAAPARTHERASGFCKACGEHTGTARLLAGLQRGHGAGGSRGEAEGRRAQSGLVGGDGERATRGAGDHKTTLRRRRGKSKSRFARLWRQHVFGSSEESTD
jgi:hypothetical protein